MTVEEMSERIVTAVRDIGGGVSFVEIVNAVGEEANGDLQLGWPNLNVVLWFGVSEAFINAFALAKQQIYPHPSDFLVYMMDGAVPHIPVAKQLKKPYKKPHWLPVVFWLRSAKQPKRLSDSLTDRLKTMKYPPMKA
jgi:hypothetical protein